GTGGAGTGGAGTGGAGTGGAGAGGAPGAGDRPTAPLFLAPRGGMGRLVERLAEELGAAGAGVERRRVDGVRATGGGVEVADAGRFDAAVLAVPAPVAARLLGDAAPPGLRTIELTSVTLVTMAYDAGALAVPPGVNGVLVPAGEGRLMTACSFGSSKWPHWATPGRVLLRVSVGRQGDTRADDLTDEGLVDRLSAEVATALGARAAPVAGRVSRWPEAFPFFRVGHLGLVAGIQAELHRRAPGVVLAGASYGGAGVPACIASGRAAAASLRDRQTVG
ncbi:MAG: protoporphyrinogen/coproporphyrinogen oxidase, partial [Acidimicrobiales bacterium]